MERIEIDINKALSPGDVIELHYRTIGLVWVQAAQIALIESKLKDKPGWRIKSWEIVGKTKMIFTIVITEEKEPKMYTAGIISWGIVLAGLGIIAWFLLDKVYQISETPAGKIGIAGIGTLGVVAAIAGLLMLLPKGSK